MHDNTRVNVFSRLCLCRHDAIALWWNDTAATTSNTSGGGGGGSTGSNRHWYADTVWNSTQSALQPAYAHSNCDPGAPGTCNPGELCIGAPTLTPCPQSGACCAERLHEYVYFCHVQCCGVRSFCASLWLCAMVGICPPNAKQPSGKPDRRHHTPMVPWWTNRMFTNPTCRGYPWY